jgi:hypothetical protein
MIGSDWTDPSSADKDGISAGQFEAHEKIDVVVRDGPGPAGPARVLVSPKVRARWTVLGWARHPDARLTGDGWLVPFRIEADPYPVWVLIKKMEK